MTDIEYYLRFKRETIYLYNDELECYIKSVPGKGYFAKFKGQMEKPIPAFSKNVTMAIDAKKEVAKEEYDLA